MAGLPVVVEFSDTEALRKEFAANLRTGGIFAAGSHAHPPQTQCELTLVHPSDGARLVLTATVVMHTPAGIALSILDFGPAHRSLIERFIDDHDLLTLAPDVPDASLTLAGLDSDDFGLAPYNNTATGSATVEHAPARRGDGRVGTPSTEPAAAHAPLLDQNQGAAFDADQDLDLDLGADFDADQDQDLGADFDANADLDQDADLDYDEANDENATPERRHLARNLHERLRNLSIAEQHRLARAGETSERVILERIYGKTVWEPLLRNPRVTTPEVARIARMGSLPRPLIEFIVDNAAWLKVAQVRRSLLTNPRLTIDQIPRVLRHVPKHELKLMHKQTAYPRAVRDAARKFLNI